MMNSDIVITGRKTLIRNKIIADAPNDYRWRIDEELASLDATSALRVSESTFIRMYEDELKYPTPWVRRYGIDSKDGVHIGNCMIYDIDTASGDGELGIMIGERAYWNQGFGLDAMAHLTEVCFQIDALKKLYLHTLTWNQRARHSFAKCGFREVGPVRRSGRDFVRMEITREEWETNRSNLLNQQ